MANFAELTVQLELQQAAFAKGMNDAAKQLQKIEAQAGRSTKSLATMEKGLSTLAAGVATLGSAFGALKGVEAIAKASDNLKNLQGSFTALTGDAIRGADLLGKTFGIVATTGAPLKDTAEAMQRLTIALTPLGASNAQISQLAENFLKLGRIGGSSAEEVSGALRQFGQALASGILGGDELKSVRENVPLAAKAIADGLGVPIGKLKEMGEQGTLTADVVANALLKATASTAAAFALLPATLEQATNKMKAQATLVTAEFDRISSISQTLVTLTDTIKENLQRWHSELVVDRESMTQFQTIAEAVGFTVKVLGAGFIGIGFGLEQIIKRMALWLQDAQALINLDWGAMEENLKRFNEQFDASERIASKRIRELFNPPDKPPEMFGPPVPTALLTGKATPAAGKGGDAAAKELEALKKRGEALAASVDPLNAYNQKLAEYNELLAKGAISSITFSRAVEAAKEALTASGDALTASVDPGFEYELTLRRINQAYRDGQIEIETWVKLQEKAKELMDEKEGKGKKSPLAQLKEDAIEVGVSGIGDFFKDIVAGSMSASEAFNKMVKAIISDLAKLLAEFAAKQIAGVIIKYLFGAAGGGVGGGAKVGAAAAPLLASVPVPSFNAARSLGVSTFAGTAADGGVTAAAASSNGSPWAVTINNYAPGVGVRTEERVDGGLEVTVERVRNALTQDVVRGGNPFSRSLEATYGMGRGR